MKKQVTATIMKDGVVLVEGITIEIKCGLVAGVYRWQGDILNDSAGLLKTGSTYLMIASDGGRGEFKVGPHSIRQNSVTKEPMTVLKIVGIGSLGQTCGS